jgi:hypothetical protein
MQGKLCQPFPPISLKLISIPCFFYFLRRKNIGAAEVVTKKEFLSHFRDGHVVV